MADKGSYFAQDKSESVASNLLAFAGYSHKISDNEMPRSLKNALDFGSGAYMGFSGFSSLWSAGGIGALSVITGDDIVPFTQGSVIVITKLQPGEKYNDISVAKRAFEENFEKLDSSDIELDPSSAAYNHELKRKAFAEEKEMKPASCKEVSMINHSLSKADLECWVKNDDYEATVIFSRPASGQEFPELATLPKAEYSVLLFNTWYEYKVREDAEWAASLDARKHVFKFKNKTLPFITPEQKDNGRRIMFIHENGKDSVIYK